MGRVGLRLAVALHPAPAQPAEVQQSSQAVVLVDNSGNALVAPDGSIVTEG